MKVLVCGGRDYANRAAAYAALDAISKGWPLASVVVHGAARGADRFAGDWAESRGYETRPYPADWDDISHPQAVIKYHSNGKPYNANAGSIRNQKMLDEESPRLVIAFPGGTGTEDMKRKAKSAHIPVREIEP